MTAVASNSAAIRHRHELNASVKGAMRKKELRARGGENSAQILWAMTTMMPYLQARHPGVGDEIFGYNRLPRKHEPVNSERERRDLWAPDEGAVAQ